MKILAIGRNYAAHASEMGNAVPDEPLVFMKPEAALIQNNAPFVYPPFSTHIDYETELVFRISKAGKSIALADAGNYYHEISVGIDFTARDLQARCKERGRPWEVSKAFDQSASVGTYKVMPQLEKPAAVQFELHKNGAVVQQGNSKQMIFTIDQIIAYVSKFFTINTGDLIFTGTPEGVGQVHPGDLLEGYLESEKVMHCEIKPAVNEN